MKDLINWANNITDPDKKKEAQEYVKEVMKNKENEDCVGLKQVNVDIKLGELRQEICIPVYIGENRMKDIHIVVEDGAYKIIKDEPICVGGENISIMSDKNVLIANFDRLYNTFGIIPMEDSQKMLSETLNLAIDFIERYCE